MLFEPQLPPGYAFHKSNRRKKYTAVTALLAEISEKLASQGEPVVSRVTLAKDTALTTVTIVNEEKYVIKTHRVVPPGHVPVKPTLPPSVPENTAPLHRRKLGRPSAKDWYLFSLELRTMIDAGVPIQQALTLLERNSERHRVKVAAAVMGRALASGQGIEGAVRGRSDLPELIRALMILGTRAGRVGDMLNLVIQHYRWMLDIRSQILRGIWYPAALVILGALIMVGRDTAVAVLGGKDLLRSLLSAGWRYYGPIVIGVALGFAFAWVLKLKLIRPYLDQVILTVPGLGAVAKKYALAVFFEVLSACIEAGMPITMGYGLAAKSTTNRIIGQRLEDSLDFLADGESLGETLRQSGVLDRGSLGVVRAGESAAEAPYLMRKLAQHFTMEVRLTVKWIVTIVTPLMIPLVAVAYFADAGVLGWLAFAITFLFMLI